MKKVFGTYIFKDVLISSITRTIHKDNVIRYEGNRYSVPNGTYRPDAPNIAYVFLEEENLVIKLKQSGGTIAKHRVSSGKGLIISDPSHRETSINKRETLIRQIKDVFEDKESIEWLIHKLKERYPRHLVDQLKVIQGSINKYPSFSEQALMEMKKLNMTSANDFRDISYSLSKQTQKKSDITALPNEKYKNITAPERTEDIHLRVLAGGTK